MGGCLICGVVILGVLDAEDGSIVDSEIGGTFDVSVLVETAVAVGLTSQLLGAE